MSSIWWREGQPVRSGPRLFSVTARAAQGRGLWGREVVEEEGVVWRSNEAARARVQGLRRPVPSSRDQKGTESPIYLDITFNYDWMSGKQGNSSDALRHVKSPRPTGMAKRQQAPSADLCVPPVSTGALHASSVQANCCRPSCPLAINRRLSWVRVLRPGTGTDLEPGEGLRGWQAAGRPPPRPGGDAVSGLVPAVPAGTGPGHQVLMIKLLCLEPSEWLQEPALFKLTLKSFIKNAFFPPSCSVQMAQNLLSSLIR